MFKCQALFGTMVLVAALNGSIAFASGESLSGQYEVIKSDCDNTGILFVGDQDILVRADDTGIDVGRILFTGEGGPGSQPYFQAALSFSVGTQKVHNLGDGYNLFEGSYSTEGNQFKDVLMFATTDGATPVYDGEVDFALTGDILEIDTTMTGQPQPGPKRVCLLKKIP